MEVMVLMGRLELMVPLETLDLRDTQEERYVHTATCMG